ncbi:MAG: hypothetical protein CVU06_09680, partial [Bacteroidetes bacterium HGW-Bacteroidetes-22]
MLMSTIENKHRCEYTMAQQTSAGTFQNVYKFNGKELDAERRSPREHKKLTRREQSGLYYYGARYYD